MKSMGHAVGSQAWREYAKEFVRIERGEEEPEEAETIHGSRVGSAARTEDEPEDTPEEEMRARHDHDQAEEGRAVKTTKPSSVG